MFTSAEDMEEMQRSLVSQELLRQVRTKPGITQIVMEMKAKETGGQERNTSGINKGLRGHYSVVKGLREMFFFGRGIKSNGVSGKGVKSTGYSVVMGLPC